MKTQKRQFLPRLFLQDLQSGVARFRILTNRKKEPRQA